MKKGNDLSNVLIFPERRSGVCQQCGLAHDPEWMHDVTSPSYRLRFTKEYGRVPGYRDAMAHCPDDIKDCLVHKLEELGIDVESDEDPMAFILGPERKESQEESKVVP